MTIENRPICAVENRASLHLDHDEGVVDHEPELKQENASTGRNKAG